MSNVTQLLNAASAGDRHAAAELLAVIKEKWSVNVGKRLPNAFGLHDMHGNVWEWCQDAIYNYRDVGDVDPVGPANGEHRIIRGGGCFDGAWGNRWMENNGCRSAVRFARLPDNTFMNIGFRVAAVISDDVIRSAANR